MASHAGSTICVPHDPQAYVQYIYGEYLSDGTFKHVLPELQQYDNATTYLFTSDKFDSDYEQFAVVLQQNHYVNGTRAAHDHNYYGDDPWKVTSYTNEPLSITLTAPDGSTSQENAHDALLGEDHYISLIQHKAVINEDDPAGVYTWHITEYPQVNGTINVIKYPMWTPP